MLYIFMYLKYCITTAISTAQGITTTTSATTTTRNFSSYGLGGQTHILKTSPDAYD